MEKKEKVEQAIEDTKVEEVEVLEETQEVVEAVEEAIGFTEYDEEMTKELVKEEE